ncbi:hypothetical protein HWV62_19149 [Athelia sp. TMB]|nr:hypothetical protein HWV62_19149 [Athelia sp. TMB]
MASFSDTGRWTGLNWTEGADWYDLRVHWRGFLGLGALTDNRWRAEDAHIVAAGNGFRLKESVAQWREWETQALQEHVNEMISTLALLDEHVPVPREQDLSCLFFRQTSRDAVYKAMATSRFYYLDLVAFYRWVREAMDEELVYRCWDTLSPARELWKTWWDLPVTGYLLDLQEHARTHNLPWWVEQRVPVHYVWDVELANNERFRAWDPMVLDAVDETEGGMPDSQLILRDDEPESAEGWPFDALSQELQPYITAEVERLPQLSRIRSTWKVYIKDFEGWRGHLYQQIYFFEDRPFDRPPSRTFSRWREKGDDTWDQIISNSQEPHRHATPFLRELYKFRYAPAPAGSSALVRPLLSRLGDAPPSGPSARGARARENRDGEQSGRARNRTRVRDRSASPIPSDRSSSGNQVALELLRIGGHSRSGSESSRVDLEVEDSQQVRSPPANGEYQIDFTTFGRWSREMLSEAVISFPDPRAQWRIRAWVTEETTIRATVLLSRAMSYFIPFHLEIPAPAIPRFMRTKEHFTSWEIAASHFYQNPHHDHLITYDANGVDYAATYKSSVLALLNKPNASAFLFEGGLVARIAYEYGGQQLVERAMGGLSAAFTLHGSGSTSIDRGTRRDYVTDYEKLVLIGHSKPAEGKDKVHFFYPPIQLFTETFGLYDGCWTPELESWFVGIKTRIDRGEPRVRTSGGWLKDLRQERRTMRTSNDHWRNLEREILRTQGPSWEGRRIANLFDLGSPGNQYTTSQPQTNLISPAQ